MILRCPFGSAAGRNKLAIELLRVRLPSQLAGTPEVLQPRDTIELGEDSANLPGIVLSLAVRSFQNCNTLDWLWLLDSEPAEGNGVAVECLEGKDLEGNRGLRTLADLEGSLAGKRSLTDWLTDERVNRVGVVDEVIS